MPQTTEVPLGTDSGFRDTGETSYCDKCSETVEVWEKDVRVPGNGIFLPHKFCSKCKQRLDQ